MFIKYSKYLLALIILLTVAGFFSLDRIKFDFEIEKYFPADDEDLAYYNDFNIKFNVGKRDEYIFIGIKNNKGIFQKDFLKKIETLTRFLQKQKNILEVYSLANLSTVAVVDGHLISDSLIHISKPWLYPSDSIKLFESEEYKDLHISKSGKHILVSAFTAKRLSSSEKEYLINNVLEKVEELKFDEVHCAAKIIVEKTYVEVIQNNFLIYIVAALLIIAITLYLMFRSLMDIIIPFLSIIISVLLTLALIALTGYTLDSISSLIPSILSIICMSNVLHISIKYKEELSDGFSKEDALIRTFKDIGLATFFTSFTTAIGFFTLCFTSVMPIRLFGLYTGLGIMISYLITAAFIFSVYALTPVPKNLSTDKFGNQWSGLISWIFRKDITYKKSIFAVTAIFTLVSVIYVSKIQINSSLLIGIPKNNSILEDYRFFEKEFAGTRVFEIGLTMNDPENSFVSIKSMKEIQEVEKYLKDSCGVGLIISPVVFFKTAYKVLSGGDKSKFILPENHQDFNTCLNYITLSAWGPEIYSYLAPGGKQARISGKIPDLTIIQFNALSEKFDRFFKNKNFSFYYKLTGSGVLLDKVTYLLFENLLYGLIIGICIMALIAGIMLRSARMGFIMLVPNIIPVLVMGAVMGLFGIYLKADTSIIFTIAFGIAVDNTIHLMSKFMIEKKKGLTNFYAMKRSFLTRGKAMIISTVVLSAGFLTLLFSSFKGTFYVGLLIAISMIVALLFDLTLTPLMIMLFFKDKKKKLISSKVNPFQT